MSDVLILIFVGSQRDSPDQRQTGLRTQARAAILYLYLHITCVPCIYSLGICGSDPALMQAIKTQVVESPAWTAHGPSILSTWEGISGNVFRNCSLAYPPTFSFPLKCELCGIML